MKNGFILVGICILVMSIGIGIGSASATVTNVDTGENFSSIQVAIYDSDTIDGHTIVVSPGVYHGNLRISKSLTIKSVNQSYGNTTILAERSGVSTIHVASDNSSIIGFRVIGAEGFLTDGSITYSTGITFHGARDCYVANCSIEGTNSGVVFAGAVNNTIEYNDIKDSRNGVFIYSHKFYGNSANNSILSNFIYDNNGIHTGHGVNVGVSENTTISNNTIYNNSGCGVRLVSIGFDCSANVYSIIGNTIIQNKKHGISVNTHKSIDILIAQNNVSYNHWDGIYLLAGSVCEIRNNTVCWNDGWGIRAIDSPKSVIEDNTCENNGFE